jgi:hypothetical protein
LADLVTWPSTESKVELVAVSILVPATRFVSDESCYKLVVVQVVRRASRVFFIRHLGSVLGCSLARSISHLGHLQAHVLNVEEAGLRECVLQGRVQLGCQLVKRLPVQICVAARFGLLWDYAGVAEASSLWIAALVLRLFS